MKEISEDGSLRKQNFRLECVLCFVTVFLSGLHLAFYRKTINTNSNNSFDFKTELYVFAWRYQIILILIILYSLISRLFKRSNAEENGGNDNSQLYQRVHTFRLSLSDTIQVQRPWFVVCSLFSNFMFLLSTYFIPLGLSIIFHKSSFFYSWNLPIYGDYYKNKIRNNENIGLFANILFLFGIVTIFAHSHKFFWFDRSQFKFYQLRMLCYWVPPLLFLELSKL